MNITPKLTHHATLFIDSERKELTQKIWNELTTYSPANTLYEQTVLDIDTARSLTTWVNTPYNEDKVALLSFHTITLPAQNALLKIIEEPRHGVRFILVTTNKEAIIPTLYSRLQDKTTESSVATNNDNALIFLETPQTKRMKLPFVTALLSQTDEEGRKDREAVRAFILSLTDGVQKMNIPSKYALEVVTCASYAGDPSASGKSLLEYLSLLLPQTK